MEFDEIISKLKNEKEYALKNYVPIIREKSAKYLYDFVQRNHFKKILEIGTAIGYSGSIIMAAKDIKLTTIDINDNFLSIAKQTFIKCGFENNVTIIHGDAWNIIQQLNENKYKFDLIFLDGAKGQYVKYLQILSQLLEKDGVIFADNVLLQGMVESKEKVPHKKRTMVVNLRKYLDKVNNFPFETHLVRLEDGIAITKIKGE